MQGFPSGPADFDAWRRRISPPDNEIPTVVPVNTVLGRSADAVIALVGVEAFTTGWSFRLAIRTRMGAASVERISRVLSGHPDPDHGDPDERLLLGVEFADGRRASTLDLGMFPDPTGDPDAPIMSPCGGGGDHRSHNLDFWMAPLPPGGDLLLVCVCAPLQIPETRIALDGEAIARAGAAATVLWPPVPFEESPPPSPPRRPATGWFAGPS